MPPTEQNQVAAYEPFTMDGMLHTFPAIDCAGLCGCDSCPNCGSIEVHGESVYGPSIIYKCMSCSLDY